MKRKNTWRVFLLFILLPAEFFLLRQKTLGSERDILINEILVNGPDGEEFVELYNAGDSDIPLRDWYWCYFSSTKTTWNDCYRKKKFEDGAALSPRDFYLIGLKGYPVGGTPDASDWQPYSSAQLGNSAGTVAIFRGDPSEETLVDAVGWGNIFLKENASVAITPTSKGFGRKNFHDTDDNLMDFEILENSTPRNKNYVTPETVVTDVLLSTDHPDSAVVPPAIIFNEILPNPKGADDDAEYIELYNGGESTVDLAGWTIKDASKNGSYVFPKDTIVNVSDYILFFRSVFEFALNNSGAETLSLFMPDDTLVDTISYSETAKEGRSYSRTGSGAWRWSKTQTPGAENIIPSAPLIGRITISKKLYVDVAGDFSLDLPDDSTKDISVRWDFGDGRKSYKVVTRHTYTQSGTFFGSVRLTIDDDEVTEAFTVMVKKYPQQKVRITGLLPNPDGTDKDSEWIEVENRSSKKVSLLGWSIATGQTQKKLVNHPIKTDVRIAPGKRVRLSAEDAAFTLANTKSRVELRYPNGTVAHTVTYKTEGVAKNARYEKPRGERWRWSIKEDAPDPTSPPSPPDENSAEGFEEVGPTEDSQEEGIVLGYSTEQLPISSLLCKKNMVTTQRLQRAAVGLSFAPSLVLHTEIPSKLSVTERSLFSNINTILNALFIRR